MKKFLIGLVLMLTVVGCESNMDNTPTKKVEAFLNDYQMLSDGVLDDLDTSIDDVDNLTNDQRDKYFDIIKSGYQKMNYTIKDETIDGDYATVTTQIEVVNHAKVLEESNSYLEDNKEEFLVDDIYDESLFMDYKLEQLKNNKEMIEYTIEFTLTKVDGEWTLDDITDEIRSKINGRY